MSRCDVNHCDFDVMSKGQFSSHGGVNSRVRGTLGMMTASMMTARVITTRLYSDCGILRKNQLRERVNEWIAIR